MIEAVLTIFGQIIGQFIIELAAFAGIIFFSFKRRKQFVIRLILALIVILSVGFALSFFYYRFGDTVWGRVLVYFFLFAVFALALYFTFNEKIITVLFALGVAYALQNLMYKVWLLLYVGIEQAGWADNWGSNFRVIYLTIYYFFVAIFIIAVGLIYSFKFRKRITDHTFNKKVLSITAFCLVAAIVLCSVQDVYFAKISTIRENHFDNPNYYHLRHSSNLLSVLISILVIYLGFKSVVEKHLEKEVEYLEHAIKQSKQQYEISKDTIEMINIKCHDIKYHIRSLANSKDIKESDLKELEESVKIYDSKFDTGNQLLNVLLMEKSLYCEQHNINFSCMIDGGNFEFMESGDLYCMFGNLIDNALEAVSKIKDKEKRIINLSARRKGNIIFIEEDNYFVGELVFKDGLPVTSKEDKNYHGFGTKSLRMIVRKYGGELSTTSDNNIFHLSIILTDNKTK